MAISNAVNLANLSSGDALTVDSANDRVGIATTTPTEALTVVGVVSATSFFGDGSNLEGVASAGLGTALGDGTNGLEVIYFTDKVLTISDTITVDPPATTNIAYTQYSEVAVDENKDLIIADGDDFIPDILGLSTEGVTPLVGAGGRVRADNFTNKAGNGAPNFPSGLSGTTGTFSGDVDIADKIIHTGDTNTAIRFPAVDTFTVETAGSERLRITSAGRFGVNTTTPNYTVDVNGEVGITEGQPLTWHDGSGNASAQIFAQSDDSLVFRNTSAGAERMRILPGGGLAFNGDTAAANALDDYEEGTWTPSIGGNASYTTQTGNYTKVGRLVYVNCNIQINVIGTGSVTTITGLPFASSGGLEDSSAVGYWTSGSRNVITLMACTNSTQIVFTDTTSAVSGTTLNGGIFQNSTNLRFGLCYQV